MSRLFSIGFENNSSTTGVEGDTYSSVTVSTTNVRSGTYALRCNTGGGFFRHQVLSADSSTAIGYLRFYLYIATGTSANTQVARFDTSANSPMVNINLTTGNQLQLLNNLAVQIGSNSATLSTATWYRIELSFNPANGAVTAYIDGSSFASGTTTTGSWSRFLLGSINGTPTLDLYFDDVAINSNAGSFQNGLPGSGKIIHLKPNAAGDNSDWTNTYTNVDEVTPNDATDFISQADSTTAIEDMNIEDPSALGASDTINVVSVGARFRGVGGDSDDTDFVVRVKASSGGTVEESSNINVNNTAYSTHSVSTPKVHPLTIYDLPGASTTAWTTSDLTNAQIGVRANSNPGFWQAARVTTVWMLVDYTPPSGTAYNQAVSGSLSFTGSDTNQTNKVLTAGLSFTGSILKRINAARTASLSFVGNITKRTTHAFTGGLSFTGTFTKGIIYLKAITGSLSFNGAFAKLPRKNMTATLSFTGAIRRSIAKRMTGGLSFIGNLGRAFPVAFTGGLSFSGKLNKRFPQRFTAGLSFSGFLLTGSALKRALTASLSFTGSLNKRTSRRFTGGLSFTGAMTRVRNVLLSAGLSFSGAINRRTNHLMTANLSFIGTWSRYMAAVFTPLIATIKSKTNITDLDSDTNLADVQSNGTIKDVSTSTNAGDVDSKSNTATVESTKTDTTVN